MTTLIEEEPFAAVVHSDYMDMTCSKCFASNLSKTMSYNLTPCAGCEKVYYCSMECQITDRIDHKAECKFLQASDVLPSINVRLVARMLYKSKRCPDFKAFNGRTYNSLKHNVEDVRKSPSYFQEMNSQCLDVMNFMGSSAPVLETVFLAYSKMAANAFAIDGKKMWPGRRGAGVYIGLSVHNHSCRPDVWEVSVGSKLLLRTDKKDLDYSENLTISYLSPFIGDTERRRKELQSRYFFTCNCEECLDEELDRKRLSGRSKCCPDGWFLGTVYYPKCSKCDKDVPFAVVEKLDSENRALSMLIAKQRSRTPVFGKEAQIEFLDNCFGKYNAILAEHNVNLLALADLIYDVSESVFNMPIMLKYVDFCLPKLRGMAYGFQPVDAAHMRFVLCVKTGAYFDEMEEAGQEYLDLVKLVYGEDNCYVDYAKKKMEELNHAGLQ